MRRLLPLLLALLAPALAAGQAPATPDLTPRPAAPAPPADDLQAQVRREVDKAKAELRDEIRAELQGQQAAKEFLEAAGPGAEKPRLQFLELGGYLRVRGRLYDDLSLRRTPDYPRSASGLYGGLPGWWLFPPPISSPDRTTVTSADMRLRLEPRLNVSEQVRVLAQVDVLDGAVLGGNAQAAVGQAVPGDATSDRDSIRVKRAWAEVQTPVGLLSFGRMPDVWGLGLTAHGGGGLDDDLGSTVDRIQLAIPVRQTALGPVALAPFYDLEYAGLTSQHLGGVGQPLSLDKADERWALGVKAVRLDTDEEIQRRLASGAASLNYGLKYAYHYQSYQLAAAAGVPGDGNAGNTVGAVKIGQRLHALDLWGRYRSKRLRVETELALRVGKQDDARTSAAADPIGPVDVLQFGGALQADYRPSDGKALLGLEVGFASGDSAPGFGNRPERGLPYPGSFDGSQLGSCDADPAAPDDRTRDRCTYDRNLRNFRFNPAYRVDLILFRELIGGVTDAWYVKPTFRYDVLEGLALKAAVIYSQAVYASSTPSRTHRPLGVELDLGLHYASDDGFNAWLSWGVLEPLDGLGYGPVRLAGDADLKRAHALHAGVAVKF